MYICDVSYLADELLFGCEGKDKAFAMNYVNPIINGVVTIINDKENPVLTQDGIISYFEKETCSIYIEQFVLVLLDSIKRRFSKLGHDPRLHYVYVPPAKGQRYGSIVMDLDETVKYMNDFNLKKETEENSKEGVVENPTLDELAYLQ